MNTRLTPDFERRIREGLLHQWEEGETAISALLAELDACRQERDEFERKGKDLYCAYGNNLIKTAELESQVEALSRKVQLATKVMEQYIRDLERAKDAGGIGTNTADLITLLEGYLESLTLTEQTK